MAATFDPTLPTLKDHLRLAIGDRHTGTAPATVDNALIQDETIQAKIDGFGYVEALIQIAEGLAVEFGQRPDSFSESGGVSIKWSERVKAWKDIAQAARAGRIPNPDAVRRQKAFAAVSPLIEQARVDRKFRSD